MCPPVIVEAPAQSPTHFDWRSFMRQLLESLGEPSLKTKANLDRVEELRRKGESMLNGRRITLSETERLVVMRIRALKPIAIFIDEAQNMVEGLSLAKRTQNVNRLKSWANTMDTKFVLFGTHEAKDLLNLNEQLSRRITPIYFPRYQGLEQEERQQFFDFFKAMVQEFEIPIGKDVFKDHRYLYNHSLGCAGLMVSWLHNAVAYCIDKNLPSVSKKVLKETQISRDRLLSMEKAIKDFESYYQSTLAEFNPHTVVSDLDQIEMLPDTQLHQYAERKKRRKPGEQLPRRHPVKPPAKKV